jgi:glutathione-independent formaldehyde dehydrogenase
MQAILWDRIKIADTVGVEVLSLNDAPKGYEAFDHGAPRKYVLDPHSLLRKAA